MFLKRTVEGHVLAGCFGLLAWLVACAAYGQSATVPSGTLRDARLPAPVKERIYRELSAEFEPSGGQTRSIVEAFELKVIEVGPGGQNAIRVWGSNRGGVTTVCGATGNCPIWVFDQQTGGVLLSADGWDFRIERTMHHGRYDIVTRTKMSCCDGLRDWYQFDGRTYQQVKQADEKY